ncbi:hypothetical protein QQS21_000885 [Conoideocrella luteorostrata]|uniref:Uncharacterized protein n=1 Tax=Conoideocrella luteorostrata TaxID=1105319 RepID=A0AAJ0FYX0_9HYPO|nr:hypothetical protein QQS21_000885 [Conoideocrella luteorostrata]
MLGTKCSEALSRRHYEPRNILNDSSLVLVMDSLASGFKYVILKQGIRWNGLFRLKQGRGNGFAPAGDAESRLDHETALSSKECLVTGIAVGIALLFSRPLIVRG